MEIPRWEQITSFARIFTVDNRKALSLVTFDHDPCPDCSRPNRPPTGLDDIGIIVEGGVICGCVCLTAPAETHDLISCISPDPLATDYRRQCIAVQMRAVDAVHGLSHEDFTIIGVFLGVRFPKPG